MFAEYSYPCLLKLCFSILFSVRSCFSQFYWDLKLKCFETFEKYFLSKGTMIHSESSFVVTCIIHCFYSYIISYLFWKLAPKIFHCVENSPEHNPFTSNTVFYRSLLIWTLHWTQLPQLESNLWFSPLYDISVNDT